MPHPKPAKPRLLQDGRDMFWSMAPLIIGCILLAGLVGMCSFQPSGPTQGAVPSYDAAGALQSDAETLGFPIRHPAVPDDWQSNSGRRAGLDAARTDPDTGQLVRALVSTVGYITGSGMYMSLTQSNADEANLVRSIQPDLVPTGAAEVNGVAWVVYEGGERGEPVWTTRLSAPQGQTQVAITGAGSVDEFRTLATATQTQAPLAPRA
ncbi:DUF4245 domain-containing protein [[Mycobacterium] burgundiense]|uniref:DUF4245 domain-containing protein n=1 Tax=[Mycobacterium] burgundiense TaxID=3064286 RepID=A0ABM9LF15_9MYCO|nr:DUF4245 domain-containing protein [Mycolicibacterium sp. MU0053]CAJ1497890.1 DUF4245 domain-containing protein [Mycolicibacterium sp. MU0053]